MTTTQFVRATATLTVAGSLLGIAIKLAEINSPGPIVTGGGGVMTMQILSALAFALNLAALAGIWRSGAIDSKPIGILGLIFATIGQVIATVFQLQPTDALGLASALTIGVGMLLVAVAMIQAGRWKAWRRYTPLICMFSPVVGFFLYPILFETMGINGVIQVTGIVALLCWLLIGLALWIETGSASSAPSQAEV